MEPRVIVHLVFCFTLLFVFALQGNVGNRQSEQGMNCHLTRLDTIVVGAWGLRSDSPSRWTQG